jgi:hypothetical protein
MVQVFRNDDEAGDTFLNILNSPPRAVHGHVLITGQHEQAPQVFTAGQVIIHGVVQVHGDDISMHPPHDPETSSSATSLTVDMNQLLASRNPEMPVALFPEPDFLVPPQPTTPYEPYLGLPPPNFDYHLHMPIPEFIKEPGVIPGDNWLCNIEGLSPVHFYTIPGLGGRMVEAPFYKYDFLPNYPELLLSQGCNCLQHSHPLRAREDPYPQRVLMCKEAYTFYPRETFTPMVDFTVQQE